MSVTKETEYPISYNKLIFLLNCNKTTALLIITEYTSYFIIIIILLFVYSHKINSRDVAQTLIFPG